MGIAMSADGAEIALGSLLVVDDDAAFRRQLVRAMERRGFEVLSAESFDEAIQISEQNTLDCAIVDIRLDDKNGLDLVPILREKHAEIKVVVLTGYGNIASAVNAIKVGAVDYLAKPADPDDIFSALSAEGDKKPSPPEGPMSADRVRWEHIQRVYELCDRNVSETARRLKMHRRTLQRILAKRSPH